MVSSKMGTGISFALMCLCLLGVMPIISNGRPDSFDALAFAFFLSVWQFIFAMPLFFWELRSSGKKGGIASFNVKKNKRTFIIMLTTSVIFGFSTYLYVLGVEKAGAISAAIAIQAYPLFAILLETVFLKRRKTGVELFLTAVLIIALYLLATGGTWKIKGLSLWFLMTLGVPFLWSIAHVLIKEELVRTSITPAQVTFFRVGISAVFLGLLLMMINPSGLSVTVLKPDFQLFALLMGLVYYLELVLWFYAVRHIDVSLASSIVTPWPALTMILAIILLGEQVKIYQVGAFIVVVACIYGLIIAGLRRGQAQ